MRMRFFFVLSLILMNVSYAKNIMQLDFFKDSEWSLTQNFLYRIASSFKVDVFVESGTYMGTTVAHASPCFKEVHSVELAEILYMKALEKFKNVRNVFLYKGDSANVFQRILPSIKGKIVFWLDGHYSEGLTAKGDKESPVIEELQAIKLSGLRNSIILIDDIRCFDAFAGYPSLVEVYAGIKNINEAYKVEIIGDILIAFLENENFDVSPVIHACTISRLAENLYTDDEILNAEHIIAMAQGTERNAFCKLNASLQNGYSLLWDGLMCMHDLRYEEAIQSFKKARNAGIKHWRLDWYVSVCAFKQKKYEDALQNLNVVLVQEPNFEKGLELLEQLHNVI